MSNDNAFFLNTFHIVTVLEMSLLSDVHNSCDDVLICGDSDVHEEDSILLLMSCFIIFQIQLSSFLLPLSEEKNMMQNFNSS